MENILPNNLAELVATTVIIFGLFSSLLSLKQNLRSHALRLFAIMSIISLSIFANNGWVYFAAVFIIATAVTELDFLQNLAAIIRGDKYYFDYQSRNLNKKGAEKKIINELIRVDEDKSEQISMREVNKALNIENLVIDKLNKILNAKIEQNIELTRKGNRIRLDGIIKGSKDDFDILIEIKWIQDIHNIEKYLYVLPDILEEQYERYTKITGRDAEFVLTLVANNFDETNQIVENCERMINGLDFFVEIYWFTYEDIGYKE